MIVLDIETTGLTHDCGICEIGAINLKNKDSFIQDCQIDEKDTVSEEALKVNGRTRKQLYDKDKQSQKQLIENYLNWVEKQPIKMFYGQNVSWDISMIQSRCIKYNLQDKFLKIHGQRGMDLHTQAQDKYEEIYGKHFLKENGASAFNLGKILEFCGLKDHRKYHNALEDCKLEAECFYRLLYGKNLFSEFAKFKIPEVLKK